MRVKCSNFTLGCPYQISLVELQRHLVTCRYQGLQTINTRNFGALDCRKNDVRCSDTQTLSGTPGGENVVGICHGDCGFVITQNSEDKPHNCVDTLRACIIEKDLQITAVQKEVRKLKVEFRDRERALLGRIGELHGELQERTQDFQSRFDSYKNHVVKIAKRATRKKVIISV